MDGIYSIAMDSPLGKLILSENRGKIIAIDFGKTESCGTIRETEVLSRCRRQLEEYFRGERQEFSLPLEPEGTDFQKKVWQALCRIPYGEVRSYGFIAADTGSPGASRAVGNANHRNPIPIIIPCHRVVAADGSLGGYAYGPGIKEKLLEIEGSLKLIRSKNKTNAKGSEDP